MKLFHGIEKLELDADNSHSGHERISLIAKGTLQFPFGYRPKDDQNTDYDLPVIYGVKLSLVYRCDSSLIGTRCNGSHRLRVY